MLSGQTQVQQRLGPDLAALIVFGQAGIALMRLAVGLPLQHLGYRPVQQHAPGQADIAVHHLAHFVVIEVIDAALRVLTQKPPLDQRLDGVQKALFGRPGQRQQSLEIETPTEHRRHIKQRPVFSRHAGQSQAHRFPQSVR